jgi:hypothetical protein
MRRILFSALFLMTAWSLPLPARAAESPASGSGTQKSGNRPAEGAKKPAPAPQAAAGTVTDATKRKAPVTKPAAKPAGSEDERFAQARKAASEDPKIVELREKADLAKSEEAGTKAMRAYLRALYGKMRTLEPSLEERINLTEAAALKAVSKSE